jgi:hypothetical protein
MREKLMTLTPEGRQVLDDMLASDDPQKIVMALRRIAELKDPPSFEDAIAPLRQHPDPAVREAANAL